MAIRIAFVVLLCCSAAQVFATNSYTFAVVPQQSAKVLAQKWVPVLRHLSEESGIKLRFVTATDIPTFEKRVAAGEYDFAYMNPYHYTVFSQTPGYQAVARREGQDIHGIVVVHKDSELNSLDSLSGDTLAFPSPAAFAASVLPRAYMRQRGLGISTQYVSSHDSVYMNVAKGIFPAGGGVTRTFKNVDPEIRKELRVLWRSEGFTPHAIASHPDVDHAVRNKVQQALEQVSATQKGKQLLHSLKVKNGFVAANDSDWDDVRALGIEVLQSLVDE